MLKDRALYCTQTATNSDGDGLPGVISCSGVRGNNLTFSSLPFPHHLQNFTESPRSAILLLGKCWQNFNQSKLCQQLI